MKKYFYTAFIALAMVGTAISCKKEETQGQDTQKIEQVSDAQVFILNKDSSNIDWKGYKIFKSESTSHFGTMKFVEGEISIKDNQIVSGKFIANTTSLANVDLANNPEASKQLDNHLKSADFFDVEKYPTATFEISKVTPSEQGDYNSILEGNLTIKGITKAISLNANIKIDAEQVSIATEQTDIDRSIFGVEFQSPIENGVIKNEITLQIIVKADLKK